MRQLFPSRFQELSGKTALITGASSGIGEAMARALADHGVGLYLTARREERLKELCGRIHAVYPDLPVTVLPLDITAPDAMQRLADAGALAVDICINNAGGALGKDPVATAKLADWDGMMASNFQAATRLIHAVLPRMVARGGGDIITLASIAAYQPYEGGSVYCAVKSAILSFCRALRQESCGQNIRIMTMSPGMVETEFSLVRFHGDEAKAAAVYQGMKPLTAEDVASQMLFALQQPRHVTMDEIITLPTDQGSATKVCRAPRS